ncbi:hypothetical protein F0U61_19135 [Archangium violaceum]|uniref:hypothetical protein n=1 Tax=Archangium violaceum TaxID=83451 RepID=UPI002B2E9ADE|nr:hypothetical protein F0U61_19135 [Archangium violaceum]
MPLRLRPTGRNHVVPQLQVCLAREQLAFKRKLRRLHALCMHAPFTAVKAHQFTAVKAHQFTAVKAHQLAAFKCRNGLPHGNVVDTF